MRAAGWSGNLVQFWYAWRGRRPRKTDLVRTRVKSSLQNFRTGRVTLLRVDRENQNHNSERHYFDRLYCDQTQSWAWILFPSVSKAQTSILAKRKSVRNFFPLHVKSFFLGKDRQTITVTAPFSLTPGYVSARHRSYFHSSAFDYRRSSKF